MKTSASNEIYNTLNEMLDMNKRLKDMITDPTKNITISRVNNVEVVGLEEE